MRLSKFIASSGYASRRKSDSLIENGFVIVNNEVEANVGGKIAQVGSRLIDMTAKKMADIFFGKFSELISFDESSSGEISNEEKIEKQDHVKPKKQNQKILIYAAVTVALVILIYFLL